MYVYIYRSKYIISTDIHDDFPWKYIHIFRRAPSQPHLTTGKYLLLTCLLGPKMRPTGTGTSPQKNAAWTGCEETRRISAPVGSSKLIKIKLKGPLPCESPFEIDVRTRVFAWVQSQSPTLSSSFWSVTIKIAGDLRFPSGNLTLCWGKHTHHSYFGDFPAMCDGTGWHYLVGGWPTPLKNMKVSWDDDIPNLWKNKID